jgi:hypothetical protein
MLDLVSEADEEHDVLPDWVGVGVLPLQALFEAPGLPGAVRVLHVAPVRLAVVDRLVAAQSVGVELAWSRFCQARYMWTTKSR